ncbi:MAG: hypothetical protein HUK20_00935 [Fibrobacter sp.]|nr:hypothetical protein [Fibrobacter sp.]
MSEIAEQTKLPSQIIFENLREMLRAKNTAHQSMFKFHWKKMWPFRLIWPQVDYLRIVQHGSGDHNNGVVGRVI